VPHDAIVRRFGETVLSFKDPHGMRLALVGVVGAENEPAWLGTDVPAEHAIRGFHSVNLLLADAAPTGAILTDIFGFTEIGREGSLVRFKVEGNEVGSIVDIHAAGGFLPARAGGGSVHHVAFRAADDAAQEEMVRKLVENHGIRTTEQKDRNYFRSVYFREPGHVLFEIATDIPGFAADEAKDHLGEALKLPAFLEARRSHIEAVLPEIA
jgi:glyoxalase family protein